MAVGDLLVGGIDVDVGTLGKAGVGEDLLDRGGRLGALRCVLEHDGVAQRQVRAREPRDLVVGVVPRHDPEQHADRAAPDQRDALTVEQFDRLVGEELLGVVGVVLVDRRAEVDLAERLVERLAHLAVDDLGELVASLGVQPGDLPDQRGPLGQRRLCAPFAVRLGRRRSACSICSSVAVGYSCTTSPVAGSTTAYRLMSRPLPMVRISVWRWWRCRRHNVCPPLTASAYLILVVLCGHLCSRLRTQPHPARTMT